MGLNRDSNKDKTKMKKQINPTIKAHLIRGAFYLLLLIAVCAIPFALAQRNSTKRGVANPASNPNTASQPNVGTPLLPYDVRRFPGLPRLSSAAHGRSPVGARAARLVRSLIPNAVYMIDDGTAEDSVGFGNGLQNFESLWFNQFEVVAGQTMISTVSVDWGTPLFPD